MAILDRCKEARLHQPPLAIGKLLRLFVRPDEVTQPGCDNQFKGMIADRAHIHPCACTIGCKERLGIDLICRWNQRISGISILPDIQPVRCYQEEKVSVVVPSVSQPIATELRCPCTRRAELILDFNKGSELAVLVV